MSFSDDQLDRYARQIILKELGGDGQRRLLEAKVVVIGAGGIGSPAIQYLAAAGVGQLTIVDHDFVELSNLHRQILFTGADLGRPKAEQAAEAVRALNPEVVVTAAQESISSNNAGRLLSGADIVLDGSDSFATRLAVADAALELRIPLVSAAVSGWEGQLAVYRGWEPGRPCYRCLVGADPERPDRSCADLGVLGPVAGVMGSLAALDVVREIAGIVNRDSGRLLLVDALTLAFRSLTLPKDPGCPACAV